MFDFLKYLFAAPQTNQKLENGLKQNEVEIVEDTINKMLLSLGKGEDNVLPLQWEMYLEELNQLPSVKVGEMSFDGVYAYRDNGVFEVRLFIRNGLGWPVNINVLPLTLVSKSGEVIAKQIFTSQDLDPIPPYSARPHKVYFDITTNPGIERLTENDWEIIFDHEYQSPVEVVFTNLPEHLTGEQLLGLNRYLKTMSPLNHGEVNIAGLKAAVDSDGSLLAAVIIRNGSDIEINMERLPLVFIDGKKRVVVGAVFESQNLIIGGNQAVLWYFRFPAESIAESDIDLTTWSLSLVQS